MRPTVGIALSLGLLGVAWWVGRRQKLRPNPGLSWYEIVRKFAPDEFEDARQMEEETAECLDDLKHQKAMLSRIYEATDEKRAELLREYHPELDRKIIEAEREIGFWAQQLVNVGNEIEAMSTTTAIMGQLGIVDPDMPTMQQQADRYARYERHLAKSRVRNDELREQARALNSEIDQHPLMQQRLVQIARYTEFVKEADEIASQARRALEKSQAKLTTKLDKLHIPSQDEMDRKRLAREDVRRMEASLQVPRRVDLAHFGVEFEVAMIGVPDAQRALLSALGGKKVLTAKDENAIEDPDGKEWVIKDDGTIKPHGKEVASPILDLRELPKVLRVAKALKEVGGVSDPDHGCGIHVHASHPYQDLWAAPITSKGIRLGQRATASVDPRRKFYAGELPPAFIDRLRPGMSMQEIKQTWRETHPRGYSDSRYTVLNLRALDDHGTFEARWLDGTLDPAKIKPVILEMVDMITTREYGQGGVDPLPNRRRRRARRRRR